MVLSLPMLALSFESPLAPPLRAALSRACGFREELANSVRSRRACLSVPSATRGVHESAMGIQEVPGPLCTFLMKDDSPLKSVRNHRKLGYGWDALTGRPPANGGLGNFELRGQFFLRDR